MARSVADDFDVQTTIEWEDRNFTQVYGLFDNTILDYFSHSPFFDRSSVNARLQMQGETPDTARMKLQRESGVVYMLDSDRSKQRAPSDSSGVWENLYVIRKLHRSEDGSEATLRYYYILVHSRFRERPGDRLKVSEVLQAKVYEAPTVAAVLRARVRRLGWHLNKAFRAAKRVVEEPGNGNISANGALSGRQKRPHNGE